MMASRIRYGLFVACLVSWSAAAAAKEPQVRGDRLHFALPDLHGRTVDSTDERFAGKVLLVTLWGTWCPPCVSEIPTLNELQARYEDDGLAVVAIAFDRGEADDERQRKLGSFVEKHEIRYLVLDGGLTSEFEDTMPMIEDVRGLPVEILIDRSGRVVECRNGYGYSEKWARRLEEDLEGLLGQAP
jgi:thiol-disulfide isomerase/thioredoxin